ncbi:MAG: helix-turn-helix domain-containing protein [Halobacteriovoraceae bacterium]|nr:helix-turn-helix domain-containing protein [Halobacteriovoraceae bacterium]
MKNFRSYRLSPTQELLSSIKKQDLVAKPPKGWIRFIRESLKMSSKALAKKVGISPNTMSETEKAEREENITLKRLRKVAESMNCDLVYYFLPRESIKEMIDKRAKHLIEERLRNMDVEEKEIFTRIDVDKIMKDVERLKVGRKLWDQHN